jgi:hypothetical protein
MCRKLTNAFEDAGAQLPEKEWELILGTRDPEEVVPITPFLTAINVYVVDFCVAVFQSCEFFCHVVPFFHPSIPKSSLLLIHDLIAFLSEANRVRAYVQDASEIIEP